MNKYILRYDKAQIMKKFNLTEMSRCTDISRTTIHKMLKGNKVKKTTAYLITKYINSESKIDDYFLEVQKM